MAELAITRYRGDTVADSFTVTNPDLTPVDITGCSFVLTTNTLKTPPDVSTQVFAIVGDVVNPTSGVVTFSPTTIQADQQPVKLYFDIEMTDASGKIQTLCVGTYTFKQDIGK